MPGILKSNISGENNNNDDQAELPHVNNNHHEQQQQVLNLPQYFPSSYSSSDRDKIRLIQRQLVVLLHANKCAQRERQATNGDYSCDVPHCETMKQVLTHMLHCDTTSGVTACDIPHCTSSRQILSHWKYCAEVNWCPVCCPLGKRKVKSEQVDR